jgi:glutamate dehydrogenase/leucine dehydrogenase
MITGWGVAEAVRHYYQIWGGMLSGKRAVIQGWGNVAAAAAFYLAKNGVQVIGIIDKEGGLINKEGYTFEEIKHLFLSRKGNTLHAEGMLSFEEINNKIWDLKAEIFIPGASSRLLNKDHVDRLIDGGIEVISCGANVPFADHEIFMGPISMYADAHIAVIPDFIANCGMARVFGYLMTKEAQVNDVAILKDVTETVERAMLRTHQFNPRQTGISRKALELSLTELVGGV